VSDRPFSVDFLRAGLGGFLVATRASAGCGQLFLVDTDGDRSSVVGVPVPACSASPYAGVAAAPDGVTVAVLEQTEADDDGAVVVRTALAVYDATGELFRVTVGEVEGGEATVQGLDFDGRWALIGGPFLGETGVGAALLVDTSNPEATAVPVDTEGAYGVRFVTLPASFPPPPE
ncbi:MAG: hypothetical protein P8N02_10795, partial [Actinomycetota bacterium]|nr:hypothetical protein [Actinomycetota bacterium]